MDNWVYVDGFRGFKDTYIPIKDVNFLVGENSTGKTSILSLITLLGSPEFWFAQEFNTDVVKLGRFRDIASAQSKAKRFSVGFIAPASEDEKTQSECYEAILMMFEEKDNNPLICQYYHADSHGHTKIIFAGNQILYRFKQTDGIAQSKTAVLQTFKKWTKEEQQDIKECKPLRKEYTFDRRQALMFIDRLLKQIYGESTKKDDEAFRISVPQFTSQVTWLAPIRSKPKRTYDEYSLSFNPEGEHTPYLIRRLLKQRKASKDFRSFIERFGTASGLFDSIDIRGYGQETASPFELRLVLNDLHLAIVNVGYGVSQALPVIVEMYTRPKGTQFTIQQPEVHLHPKAQAALGDVIYELATKENKQFYIETHSDYIIDRFRLNCRSNQGKVNTSSQVLFFGRNSNGNYVAPIEILENGEYPEEQPKAFREFFIHEQMSLLGL